MFDTVTVYRRVGTGLSRRVYRNCHYEYTDKFVKDLRHEYMRRQCLLMIPGQAELAPGDRVYPGLGPLQVDWDSFLPVNVPGLSQLTWAQVHHFYGKPHHTEAGS